MHKIILVAILTGLTFSPVLAGGNHHDSAAKGGAQREIHNQRDVIAHFQAGEAKAIAAGQTGLATVLAGRITVHEARLATMLAACPTCH